MPVWLTGLHTAGGLVHFSLVLVQLDLVNLIPSFPLSLAQPGARVYACYCLLDDKVGVGLEVHWGELLLGIMRTKSFPQRSRAT